jgi:hypothetical protein
MSARAVYPPSGSSGELQFVNSSGLLDAAQAFWDSANSKLFISGNLEVLGTETVIDTLHLQIEDRIIGLATGSGGEGAAGDRGLIFLISGETNPSFYWDELADEFRFARLNSTPGDATFENPDVIPAGGYQDVRVKTIHSVSGAAIDTSQRTLASIGDDAFFFVSGSGGSKGTSLRSTSVFGGDVVISGTLYGGSPLKIGGELEFSSAPGATTSIQNKDGSVKIFASEEVKIGSDAGSIRLIDLGGSTAGKIFVTGSANPKTNRRFKFLSKGQIHFHGENPNAVSPGSDVFLFMSGAIDSKKNEKRGLSLFGGDLLSSGSLISLGGISGSLTRLHDNTSYLISGNDITIASSSNGSISISSNAQDQRNKFVYDVTGSHSAENNLVIPSLDFSLVSFDPKRVDVFVNGQLMTSGSSKDYTIPDLTALKFYFQLLSGDIVSVRTY